MGVNVDKESDNRWLCLPIHPQYESEQVSRRLVFDHTEWHEVVSVELLSLETILP